MNATELSIAILSGFEMQWRSTNFLELILVIIRRLICSTGSDIYTRVIRAFLTLHFPSLKLDSSLIGRRILIGLSSVFLTEGTFLLSFVQNLGKVIYTDSSWFAVTYDLDVSI
jgi:hypothetical protein